MSIKIKPINHIKHIQESIVEKLPRGIKEQLVNLRKPFKTYGSDTRRKLLNQPNQFTNSNSVNHINHNESFDYQSILTDTRPKRNILNLAEATLPQFVSNLFKSPKPFKIERKTLGEHFLDDVNNYKKQKFQEIDLQKRQIKKRLNELDRIENLDNFQKQILKKIDNKNQANPINPINQVVQVNPTQPAQQTKTFREKFSTYA